jgi:hypothetical protein
LLRGYDEDDLKSDSRNYQAPGTTFEPSLPVWRLGEFLFRLTEVASAMFEPGFDVTVACRWTGLVGAGANVLVFSRFEIAGSVTSEKPLAPSHGRGKAFTAINRPLNRCNRADQLEEDRQMTMQSKNTDEEALHGQTG